MNRRVVVTGMGAVTPVGKDVASSWESIISSRSGVVSTVGLFDWAEDFSAKAVANVKTGQGKDELVMEDYISTKEQSRSSRFINLGMIAVEQAVEDSGIDALDEHKKQDVGVLIASGMGGLMSLESNAILLAEKRKSSPFFLPGALINLMPGKAAIKYGFGGPNFSIVSACASGGHAIGEAAKYIQYGRTDLMVCGGAEATICRLGWGGFVALRALSTSFSQTPEVSSRPWDKARDGFVMGEGAGVLILEEYEHAKARNANIYGEFLGYGVTCDAYHITAPETGGKGAKRAMKMALDDASLNVDDISYINAHGTSTPLGDEAEFKAVYEVFGSDIVMSSTKSATGHLLGAAGAVEAVFSIQAMNNDIVPPTINLDDISENCTTIDLCPNFAQDRKITNVMSNNFGFGGTNSSLIFGKV